MKEPKEELKEEQQKEQKPKRTIQQVWDEMYKDYFWDNDTRLLVPLGKNEKMK